MSMTLDKFAQIKIQMCLKYCEIMLSAFYWMLEMVHESVEF